MLHQHSARVIAGAAIAMGALAGACSLIKSYDGFTGGGDEVPVEGGTNDGSSPVEGGVVGVDGSIESGGPDAGPSPCPSGRGPKMVEAISSAGTRFCIDSTEVTQSQYQAFLTSKNGDMSGQPARCDWNTSFLPGTASDCDYVPAVRSDRPVACVDWCDAYAFCAWAGKRLCGKVGGGPQAWDGAVLNDATQSQWYAACALRGAQLTPYPYGGTYNPQECRSKDTTGVDAGAWPVGSHPSCEGGQTGIFDMSGNVNEWTDACKLQGSGDADMCVFRGGSFYDTSTDTSGDLLRCDKGGGGQFQFGTRVFSYPDLGIRCCAD